MGTRRVTGLLFDTIAFKKRKRFQESLSVYLPQPLACKTVEIAQKNLYSVNTTTVIKKKPKNMEHYLLPRQRTIVMGLAQWRISLDELFALDPSQLRWYSLLSATRFVFTSYAITRALFTWMPPLKRLQERRASLSPLDTSTQHFISALRAVPAFIATYAVKSTISHTVAPYVGRVFNLAAPLPWWDLAGRALRCIHYAGTRLIVTNDPRALSAALSAAAAAASERFAESTTARLAAHRCLIAYACCEGMVGRFLRFFMPLGTMNAFRMADATRATAAAIGTDAKGRPRLSTTTVTTGSFERFGVTPQDVTAAFVQYFISEFIGSFVRFGLITKAQHGRFEWRLERHLVVLCIRLTLISGLVGPMLSRALGPLSTTNGLFGSGRLRLPTGFIVYLGLSFTDALLTPKIYERYIRAKCVVSQVLDRLAVNRQYHTALAAEAKAKELSSKAKVGPSSSSHSTESAEPPLPSELVYQRVRREKHRRFVNKIIGADCDALSQRELIGVRDFAAYHYVNGIEGFPFAAALRLGLVELVANIINLEAADTEEAKQSAAFLERQARVGAQPNAAAGTTNNNNAALGGGGVEEGSSLAPFLSMGSRRRDVIVLERALRAGTLQRRNVPELMSPIVPVVDSVADLAAMAASIATAPSSPIAAAPNVANAAANAVAGVFPAASPAASPTSQKGGGGAGVFPMPPPPRDPSTLSFTEEDPCPICLRGMRPDDEDIVVGSRCGHAFHTCCMKECLKQSTGCPLCRADLAPRGGPHNFVIPAPLRRGEGEGGEEEEEADEEEEEEEPFEETDFFSREGAESILRLIFNRSGAKIIGGARQHCAEHARWRQDHEALLNHLLNEAAKGQQTNHDLLTIVRKLDKLHRSQGDEAISRAIPKEMRLYAEVAKMIIPMIACPLIFYVDQSDGGEPMPGTEAEA